jgi:hypothetical protein
METAEYRHEVNGALQHGGKTNAVAVMKLFQTSGLLAGVVVIAGLTACSKPEQTPVSVPAPTPPPVATSKTEPAPTPVVVATPTPAPTEAPKVAAEAVKATEAPPAAASVFNLAKFKMPDFQSASVEQLASTATQVLTGLGEFGGKTSPTILSQVEAVKTSLSAGKALDALSKLKQLGETVKAIPGAEALLTVSKQVVSAWALKQGFDPAKISGALGSLQKGDWVGLAGQAASLLGKGGVSGEQKSLLDGVLGNFGLSAGTASSAAGALKGLLGK